MSFDLEKYEEAIMSQDDTRRVNAGLELAEAVEHMSQEDLQRYSQPIVDMLLESLRKNDWEIRNLISNALVKIGKLEFVAKSTWFWRKLIATYTDVDAGLRSSAMDLLKELGRSEYSLEILEPLIEGIQNSDKDMRILSANTLGRMKAREVVPMLVTALDDDNPNVVYNLVECLGDIGDPRAVPALMDLLTEHTDEWVHVATLEALGKIGDQRVVDLLLSLVSEELVVDPLISALGVLGDSRAIPTLVSYLKDKDPDIRELSVQALVSIWEEVEAIANLTKVSYELEATRAILERALTAHVKNTLLRDMKNEEMSEEFRENCAVLLSCIGYQKALKPIVHLLEVFPLSKKVIYALDKYGRQAFSKVAPFLEHSDFRIRQSVGLYLQGLVKQLPHRDSKVEKALIQLAEDENPVLTQIALEGLDDLRSTSSLGAFMNILRIDPENLGETIVDILSRFPKRSVYNLVQSQVDETNEDTLPYFLKLFGMSGGQVDYLKKFVRHSNPIVQEAAILAIGSTENPKGIPLLLPFIMSRQNSLTRCAATQSLRQLILSLKERLPQPRNIFDALFVMLNTYRNEEELAIVAKTLGSFCSLGYKEITEVNIAVVRGRLLDLIPGASLETKVQLLDALHGIVDMSSFSTIREFRRFDSFQTQQMVASLYSQFDLDLRVIADVADMISHAEYAFRKYWVLTAGKLCAVELTDMLVPLLAGADFRGEAFQALVMMGADVLPHLSKWTDHEDPRIQKMTALVLSRISQDKIDRFCQVSPKAKGKA